MQEKFRAYLLAATAAAMTVACGGGGDDSSTGSSATSQGSTTTSDTSCFVLPATGKTATVTATSTIPVQVEIATLTGLGTQTFEGQSYPALDERNRIDQVTGSDEHHTLYMLPGAPFLPAGAVSFPSAGDTDPSYRYAYTYTRMTLEQLRNAVLGRKATYNLSQGLTYSGLTATVPTVSDFQLNTPVTLLMLEQRAGGTDPLPSSFTPRYMKELTITYAGREDVTVGGTTYAQACKLNVSVRRSNFSVSGQPFDIDNVVTGSTWFAPGVGLVKTSVPAPILGSAGSLSATVTPAQ
ncbi:hypothetical protein ABXT21_12280 [Ralstonia sp. SM1864_UCD524_TZ4]|nr:hypothetical protein [Ralstonia pseudosolanacearum]CUV24072.1 putative transmembrane lipoprotein [Ralstonia solanacearum]CUV38858.1 putative transmembrane lipoprotein [Ralstonia solanacearum]CUV62792.1 putative transmembrane lipoprotein [Ralstonia solanacearum]